MESVLEHLLTVQTKSHDYPIMIGADLLRSQTLLSYLAPYIGGKQVLIVTNETVAPLYLSPLVEALAEDYRLAQCILPDGEAFKNQASINAIYDALMEAHFNRDATLIALGGGVIGDMTGFAAASFMRGVDFIQIPTTLLAQVDSSVGGKTGINHPKGKNMIGAFWQPKLVLADMKSLTTLPMRELSAGMAEVIKYALIMDGEFLSWLEKNMAAMMALDLPTLAQAVQKCCVFKAQIVAEDERESGRRALLNLGHTFGHVIETYEGYGNWLHGEAVAVGMVQAAQLSCKMGQITPKDVDRIKNLLIQAKLPIKPPKIPLKTALELMGHDKKVQSGKLRLILLKSLGEATITSEFDPKLLAEVLKGDPD